MTAAEALRGCFYWAAASAAAFLNSGNCGNCLEAGSAAAFRAAGSAATFGVGVGDWGRQLAQLVRRNLAQLVRRNLAKLEAAVSMMRWCLRWKLRSEGGESGGPTAADCHEDETREESNRRHLQGRDPSLLVVAICAKVVVLRVEYKKRRNSSWCNDAAYIHLEFLGGIHDTLRN